MPLPRREEAAAAADTLLLGLLFDDGIVHSAPPPPGPAVLQCLSEVAALLREAGPDIVELARARVEGHAPARRRDHILQSCNKAHSPK